MAVGASAGAFAGPVSSAASRPDTGAQPEAVSDRCARVQASAPIAVSGRLLIEIPDIPAPELRLANQLLSSGCTVEALALLQRYRVAAPNDHRSRYLDARLAWIRGSTGAAEPMLLDMLETQPDFSSAKMLLSENGGRFAEARALLESPRAGNSRCPAGPQREILLAQAYLMEAARLGPRPSTANEELVSRARELLEGDFTALADWTIGRPQYAVLQPFIASQVGGDAVDRYGRTLICQAVMRLDAAAVRDQLDAGADPNGRCNERSLVGAVVWKATRERVAARQEILHLLLERGALPTDLEYCASPANGDCSAVLLPLLRQYTR